MPDPISFPIGAAFSRTGEVMFRPFRFKKWFILALPAGLTLLGDTGLGFNPNIQSRSGPGAPSFQEDLHRMFGWLNENLSIVITVAAITFAVIVALWVLSRWLNSHGRFMFFDNLVNNDTRIAAPWREYRAQARSLWILRLVWDLLQYFLLAAVWAIPLLLVWPDLRHYYDTGDYEFTRRTTWALLVGIPALLLLSLARWVANSILLHLAVPVMFIRRQNAWPAIRIAWHELFLGHVGPCLLYFLLLLVTQIVWFVWFVMALLVFCAVTLCIGYIAAIIPIAGSYVHGLITLPVVAFKNTFKLHFISQFGEAYHITWQYPAQGGFPVIMDEAPPQFPL